MAISLKRELTKLLHKNLLVDLLDRASADALKAFEMVRDRSGLDSRRARELEGQARFRMMEQGFQEVCELHGGRLLEGGVIPHTDLKIFQPFMRFSGRHRGVIFGLASIPEPKAIPSKNKSRLAGVTINFNLSPRFDFDGAGAKIGDIFALFLVSRDPRKAGAICEVAVGVVSSNYESYVFYEPVDEFLSAPSANPTSVRSGSKPTRTVKLKKSPKSFVPPELPKTEEDDKGAGNK